MRYDTLLGEVEQAAGLSREQAERAVQATVQTLAERVTGGEAREMAVLLPRELRTLLTTTPEEAERFGLDEFLRRIAEREGVEMRVAAEHARAVFAALGMALAPGEIADIASQLPKEFDGLLEAAGAGRRQAMAHDDVVLRVAVLAGLDRDRARRATQAVLEVLAARLSDGEVDDLETELPANLRASLELGLRESRAAKPMSVDEFLRRVAEREAVGPDDAERHTRAVFAVLREVISQQEFSDMAAQLSADYEPLLAAP